MGRLYYNNEQEDPAEFCSALAIGDSWFWYPNQNMMETLVRDHRTSDDHANVRLIGYNGAELQQYVGAGKYAKMVEHWLSPNFNDGFSEFYISGAGNDAVDYSLALRPNCAQYTAAADCFDPAGLETLLRRISSALGSLIHDIRWAYRNDHLTRPIFIHGYDYPTPDGRGFELGPVTAGPWLAPAMDNCHVKTDMALRCAVMRILIDHLNEDVFKPFDTPGNEVVHIDSRGTLRAYPAAYEKDWTNELHPTSKGFAKIFDQCWVPKLAKYRIVNVPATPAMIASLNAKGTASTANGARR